MDKVEKGKLVISASKSLKGFQIGDPRIATFLYATLQAGRVGLFISAIRSLKNASFARVRSLAGVEGIDPHQLNSTILPWLESVGLCRLKKTNGAIDQVDSLILTYEQLLGAVADYYESLNPTDEDRGCLLALSIAMGMPTPESLVIHKVALSFGEEKSNVAISLAKGFNIVDVKSGSGLPEPLLYSSKVWAGAIGQASKALRNLDVTDREIILHFVDIARKHQGVPESVLRVDSKKNGAEHLLNLALGVGLLDRTEIVMDGGRKRAFITSPHFYTDLAEEFGEDMCDRVKIFLDSIRNGQHFGHPWTGRIIDPEILLGSLLRRGTIGPATAIRTDYVLSEKAGIVRVRPAGSSSRGYMDLVQEDTVKKVLEIISTGSTDPSGRVMSTSNIVEGYDFKSIEQSRVELGKQSADMAEAENAIILQLRES